MPIRAVSLDVGWTLAYPRESMWEIFAAVCRNAGARVHADDVEAFVRSIWTIGQQHAEEQLKAGAAYSDSDEEFSAQFRVLGELVFRHLGLMEQSDNLMEQFFRRFWDPEQWQLFPDAIDAVRALRAKGLRIGVLSNAPSNMPRLLERLGILPHLDYTVISAVEGVRKPDKRIFLRTLQRAGSQPGETVHVGDMYVEDVLGGVTAGLTTFLIDRGPNALFPNFREAEGRNLPPERVVRTLEEFVQRLAELG